MILKPWTIAVDSQLDAFKLCDNLVRLDTRSELHNGWKVDRALLARATPYMWSKETIAAVLEASKTIPLDTVMNKWNLQSEHSWWYFDTPLPFETITSRATTGVRALAFGFVGIQQRAPNIPFGYGMPVVCWIDDNLMTSSTHIAPSQVFEWEENQTLGQQLEATRASHQALYGPGGKWEKKEQMGLEAYMQTTEGVARFLLAGLAWLKQRVAVTSDEPVERHRRKEVKRVIKREVNTVRVVSLRRAERTTSSSTSEHEHREFSVRWVVSGHWRNQPCGPKSSDRRLTYILPYVKGPDDAPLKTTTKVFTVDR